jgi:membrane-associated phospholipid phosphatase
LPSRVQVQAVSAAIWFSALIASTLLVVVSAPASGLHIAIDVYPSLQVLATIGVLVLLALKTARIAPRISMVAASYLVVWVGGLAGAILSMVGTMFRFPFIDRWLAAADAALGLTTADVVSLVVAVPSAAELLYCIYFLSVALLFLTAFGLAVLGRAERLWEFCATYAFCLAVATICSLVLPAAGAFEYLGLERVYGHQLPPGSGVYSLEVLHAIRNSSRMVINPMELYGLVTFPSFHTAMALMTAAAWRDDRYLRWPMFIWNALVILSTLPIGGHYLVDVIAGALTWFLVFRYGAAWANTIISARSDATAPALAADL